jgi:RNA polymerase sigma-70 factor (ECF subfamily)
MAPTPPTARLEEELFTEVSEIARRIGAHVAKGENLDDLVHDVVLRCLIEHRKGRLTLDRERLPGLVKMLVLVHTAHGLRRTRRRAERDALHEQEMRDSDHVWMSPDLAIDELELEDVYERTLDSLTPACRRAYTLVRDDGLTYSQAAARLGLTRSAISFHLVTAQNRFREALRAYGVSVPAPNGGGRSTATVRSNRRRAQNGAPNLRLVDGDGALGGAPGGNGGAVA